MFEPETELASDLEWMLQSGQATDAMLAEALVQEYAPAFYLLAQCLYPHSLLDAAWIEAAAQDAALGALSGVMASSSSYATRAGRQALNLWVLCQGISSMRRLPQPLTPAWPKAHSPEGASEVSEIDRSSSLWRTFRALPEPMRMGLALQLGLGLDAQAAAQVLGLSPGKRASAGLIAEIDVSTALDTLQRHFFAGPVHGGDPATPAELQDRLVQELQRRKRAFISPSEMELAIRWIINQAQGERQRGRRLVGLQEALWVGGIVLLVAGLFWAANRFWPEPLPGLPAASGRAQTTQAAARPTLTPTPSDVFYTVERGDSLFSIARRFGVPPAELRDFNRLPEAAVLSPGQLLVLPGRITPDLPPQDTLQPTPQPLPPPLSETSTWSDISQQSNQFFSSVQTFWIDGLVVDYGPEGYLGPPLLDRLQLLGNFRNMLFVFGPAQGDPEAIFLAEERTGYVARPGVGELWFHMLANEEWDFWFETTRLEESFRTLLGSFLTGSNPEVEFMQAGGVVEFTSENGQPVLVIQRQSLDNEVVEQLWLDAVTGLALHASYMDPERGGRVARQSHILDLAYNFELPAVLLAPNLPWRGGYLGDETGGPVDPGVSLPDEFVPAELVPDVALGSASPRLPYREAPPDLDRSQARLQFQYPALFEPHADEAYVDVFGDEYYLGSVELGNPWSLVCQRSPDGRKLAYVSQPGKHVYQNAFLRWFDLAHLDEPVHRPLTGIYVTHLAFAPDSRQIAVFGYDSQLEDGTLYILDTLTDKARPVGQLPGVENMVWSPNGEELAVLGNAQANRQIWTLEIRRDVFQPGVPAWLGTAPPGAGGTPVYNPQAFPEPRGGLEECIQPPP